MREWIRDRGLGVLFVSVFVVASWVGELVVEWLDDVNAAAGQSELLQLSAFTIARAYVVDKGSSESRDGAERFEARLDALLEPEGIDPEDVERALPGTVQPR